MTPTQEAAMRQALEAMSSFESGTNGLYEGEFAQEIAALRAALAEDAMQSLTDVQQEMERNFCPRCGKRTNDIHTCTPPHEEHFCDTHCTWADHAPGCVRAEPVQEPVAWLSRDDARLALWEAINKRDFGNPTDDKLILEHLRQHGLWIGKYTAPPQRKENNDA